MAAAICGAQCMRPSIEFDQCAQQLLGAAFARDVTGKARRCAGEDVGIDLVQREGHKFGFGAGTAQQPRCPNGVGLAEID